MAKPPPQTALQPQPLNFAVLAIEHPLASAGTPLPANQEISPQRQRSLARAAQSDILRRLTPPLRHDMVVHLQSLGMMAEALNARMERGVVNQDDLASSVSKLNRLSRQAVKRCLEVCEWMEAGEDDTVPLREGVAEIVRLVSTSLNFRGFDLRTELGDGEFEVSRSALRFLLAAAILTLTDAAPAPGEVAVRTEISSSHGVVAVEYQPLPEGSSFTQLHDAGESPLAWPEVQSLANEHGVELLRSGLAIILRLPRAVVTSPLKMVPV
ncbi:MAG: hypothetical protein JWP22_848 [Ramlibacter sp.]|jgi:hypothetical protein|nr:hypothetical protein [Ramlibacter sp.]MDB5912173.1 hypothetical protein [Ramlibacter sp.]